MSDVVIKVENLSKQYRLGAVGTGTLSHDLNRFWAKIRGKEDPYLKIGESNDRTRKGESQYVWALKDINFEVKRGEVLGVIGRNGAGKSTLLKILSQITRPTTGSVKMKGRVGSLLEVGTGFHPDLTGRENVYINGAILGMRKWEIDRKLDEIIDFAGVERYIDTPVKRYSSGMMVRLGFSVAAHLEPEILIVDEVLAVGDAEFQKKCLGKMGEVSKNDGRTILFVSHNLAAVKTLCTRGIVMEHGQLKLHADVEQCAAYYLNGSEEAKKTVKTFDSSYEKEKFKLVEINIRNENSDLSDVIREDLPIELETRLAFNHDEAHRYHLTYHLHNEVGEALFSFSNAGTEEVKNGENRMVCTFPTRFFQPGTFYLSIFIVEDGRQAIFSEKDIFSFTVIDGERKIGAYMGREPGYVRPRFEWRKNDND